MSHNVTITLPDEIYQPLNEIAGRRGQTLAEFACEKLAQSVPRENHTDAEAARKAEELFARHIGAWDSGDPNSADNERIDADLAGEYAGVREEK
jgi:predicted transcriptional regulator